MAEDAHARWTARWFETRSGEWREIESMLPTLEDRKPVPFRTLLRAMHDYPELARDVAIAETAARGGSLARELKSLYGRLHASLFRRPHSAREAFLKLLLRDAPAVTRALGWHIMAITTGFLLAAGAGWWLVDTFPELARLFASRGMIEKVEQGELWTDDLLNVVPSSLLSARIFTNNIMVTLTAVSLGVLYGLGTIYIIGLNGLMLGGVFAFTAQHGMAMRLFEFVAAHGFVELSVICVAGAVGFRVGESIARPGHLTRVRSFRQAFADGGRLLLVCSIFLVGAGLIEGYVSPNDRFSLAARLSIGLGYWVVFVLTLYGWENVRPAAGPAASGSGKPPTAPGPVAAPAAPGHRDV